jgi:hypothetical protein
VHWLINGWGYEKQGNKNQQGIVGVVILFDWHPNNIPFQ